MKTATRTDKVLFKGVSILNLLNCRGIDKSRPVECYLVAVTITTDYTPLFETHGGAGSSLLIRAQRQWLAMMFDVIPLMVVYVKVNIRMCNLALFLGLPWLQFLIGSIAKTNKQTNY